MSSSQRSQAPPTRDPRALELQLVVEGATHTLVLTGELDLSSVATLTAAVAHLRMGPSTKVRLDLRKLAFIDSTGVRAILVIKELCGQCGCEFLLVPGPPAVRRVFEICGLLDHLPFSEDVHDRDRAMSAAGACASLTSERREPRTPSSRRRAIAGDEP
jgi:anti-sigma B factor antagonist